MSVPDPYPKLLSPYVREPDGGRFVVTEQVRDRFEWVFDRAVDVMAVEKLDGTNAAVKVEDGIVADVYTRLGDRSMQTVDTYGHRNHHFLVRAVQNSLHRGYLDRLDDGLHYGEVVGPAFGGRHVERANPHELDEFLFIPFQWARRKLEYESYGEYGVEFDDINEWLQDGLFSLFATKFHNDTIDAARETRYVEGLIFYRPGFAETGLVTAEVEWRGEPVEAAMNVVKLRRDMFPWFDGERAEPS